MQFKEIQQKILKNVTRYAKQYNIKIDEEFALIKLYEEIGELSQAILIHKKKSRPEKHLSKKLSKKEVAKELADVIGITILNAHLLDIDLEEAINKK